MKSNADALTSLLPTSKYIKHPYYIVVPAYDAYNAEIRLCHELCSLLNQSGYESYVDSPVVEGCLWTPVLTSAIKVSHYKANKKPIVIYLDQYKSNPLNFGVSACVFFDINIKNKNNKELIFKCDVSNSLNGSQLILPVADVELFSMPEVIVERYLSIVYLNKYIGINEYSDVDIVELSPANKKTQKEIAELYKVAKVFYTYEWSIASIEARLCGCPVVFIPNEQCLPERPPAIDFYGVAGVAWGTSEDELERAQRTVCDFRNQYLHKIADCSNQLNLFVDETQNRAIDLSLKDVWPQDILDILPGIYTEPIDLAACADRRKWKRINEQYKQWQERSSLREIDAQIYAELAVSGNLPELSIVIDQRGCHSSDLADTLDSLMGCLGQPFEVIIVSTDEMPAVFTATAGIKWIRVNDSDFDSTALGGMNTDWTLLVQAGTQLNPNALMEWAWAATASPTAVLIYADEDVLQVDGTSCFPHFKPDANIELLRCSNYLGCAILVQSVSWRDAGVPLFDGGLYAFALLILEQQGCGALAHVDTVLFHGTGRVSIHLENQEFELASQVLKRNSWTKSLRPLDRVGTWLVEYVPPPRAKVSMVIPTGMQTGYLRSLLEALARYPEPALIDIVLVCQPHQVEELRFVIADLAADIVQIVALAQDNYSHAAALNAGVEASKGDYILVADDDTEPLHNHWLSLLLGILSQPDVGCVAPRLLASKDKDTKIAGGPLILGINSTCAPYLGEAQYFDEVGAYSRLQLSQDTSAVAGHFFLMRKVDWSSIGGFDEAIFKLHFTVLDFCLRLTNKGKRHVWTPLTGVLHQGGKTLAALKRDVRLQVALTESEIRERENLLKRWAQQLARDPNYNRHLSLIKPFDIEADIVVDWQPKRHDRPRAMAVPLHSGAGQYRVIEPLNALQDAGLAQSCVILPLARGHHRVLQPLELVRAAPDRLILQHSVDDGQLRQIENYKRAAPDLKIVQMVDDLFGEVPEKHPSRQFQTREGHQRMMQALTQSDRMIVTTQPLLDHYQRYVSDVRIVPNALDKQWLGLCKPPQKRNRLRVGWVGAGQHHGDLELITEVVRELAKEVDWVFMGMSIDAIRPLLKEFHSFVSIADYPKKMSELDLDIAIAPLEDNIFNRCKSNLRLLEYGAMGWPVVCSDVYPFSTSNPPVIKVENKKEAWINAIRILFDDKKRKKNASELNQWLYKKYLLSNYKKSWFSAIFSN